MGLEKMLYNIPNKIIIQFFSIAVKSDSEIPNYTNYKYEKS